MSGHAGSKSGVLIIVSSFRKSRGNGPKNRDRTGKTGKRARVYWVNEHGEREEFADLRSSTFGALRKDLTPELKKMGIHHTVAIEPKGATFIRA